MDELVTEVVWQSLVKVAVKKISSLVVNKLLGRLTAALSSIVAVMLRISARSSSQL